VLAGTIPKASDLYSAFDYYLSTSTKEGLGSALLDAVTRGITAVALDSGGSRDIFEEGDSNHCVTERLFLERVEYYLKGGVDNLKDIRRDSVRERFSVEQLVKNHIEVYKKVIESRGI
jgi:glycosyltransferase involved in cell wall biosynthesis